MQTHIRHKNVLCALMHTSSHINELSPSDLLTFFKLNVESEFAANVVSCKLLYLLNDVYVKDAYLLSARSNTQTIITFAVFADIWCGQWSTDMQLWFIWPR